MQQPEIVGTTVGLSRGKFFNSYLFIFFITKKYYFVGIILLILRSKGDG